MTSAPSTATVTTTQSATITVQKSALPTTVTTVGQSVAYSFLVKNTGNVTLTSVSVADLFTAPAGPALSISCPVTTLAAGASTTCTATYSVKQADLDAGTIVNSATVSGTPPTGPPVTSPPSTATVTATTTSALQLTKSAVVTDVNANGVNDLGDTIAWSFLVKNTGTSTLTTVAVADPIAGAVTCPVTPLAPGASTTCTAAPHTITQADVDAGVVNNTATASAKNPAGTTVPSNPSSTSTPVTQASGLQLTKSAAVTDVNGDGKTDLGDTIAWSFLVKNTGTTTLTTVAVADPKAGAVTCPVTSLVPGASTTCTATATYSITQADVDAGVVNNTATASAKNPAGTTVPSNPSSTSTPVAQASGLQLTKSAAVTDVNGDFKTDLGDTIAWSFLVKNTGTTTITNLAVTDPTAGAVTCPATPLAPGASTTCTATTAHVITQAEVDAGVVSNTATASGKDPGNTTVPSNPSSTDTPVVQASALQLTKSAVVTDVNASGTTDLGDTIAWSFLVKNTGTTTLTNVAVSDPVAGAVTCPVTTLAPGASTTCTATAAHSVTQADVDAGVVNNTATAAGKNPAGATVPSNPSSTSTPVMQSSALVLTKSAAVTDVDGDGKTDLGDTIAWSFLVQNTGTTTITNLVVTDPTAGPVTCPVTTLAPSASTTCTAAPHPISQADVDAGLVNNTATATGKSPSNATVTSNPSSTSTPVVQTSAFS